AATMPTTRHSFYCLRSRHHQDLHSFPTRRSSDLSSDEERTVIEQLQAGHRAYVESYKRNAKLMFLLEQVAAIDANFRRLRLDRARAFSRRNCRWIRKLQDEGYVDPSLDPLMSARALSAMVGRMAYFKYAVEEPDWGSDELLVETATKLW